MKKFGCMIHSTKIGENKKLKTRWKGPYKIIRQISPVVFILEKDGRTFSANINRLKRAFIKENNLVPETEIDKQTQIQHLEDEIQHIKLVHQQLLERQQLKEIEIERLKYDQTQAASVATKVMKEDAHEDENIDSEDEEILSDMSMVMVKYLHENTVKWT